jgi:hypothetical protein
MFHAQNYTVAPQTLISRHSERTSEMGINMNVGAVSSRVDVPDYELTAYAIG